MIRRDIICQFHIYGKPRSQGCPEQHPHTIYDVARQAGWRRTTEYLFSMDGEAVWICPDCVRKTRGYLLNQKDDAEMLAVKVHQSRVRSLSKQLQDEKDRWHARLAEIK